ncbi:MAG: protein kinase [Deltaproteobacteria bacterium]|nr:protein kinase [Deltaproteobacteria bacterium]
MTETSGRYIPLFDLAAGGMGVVSVAQLRGDRGFRKTVAVKRIHPQLASDAQFYELLAREAHVASLIRDPGVVQVHELVEQNGELVLAMELVEGVSLKKLQYAVEAAEASFPIAVAARILAKVGRALHAAHTATDESGHPLSIVHRDVSPQNVLLSFRGDVKVTDFGIAKALASEEATRSSTVRGKPAYLSPEQISGEAVDLRSDIWSLGIVAFELVTGRRLFKGRNDLETLRLLLEGEIPYLDAVRADVPSALASAVHRALQRDPAARWSSALDFAQAIESSVEGGFARRDDVAALLATYLPDEERAFTDRLRGALASALDAASAPRVIQRRVSPRPFRFAGLMASAFAVTLAIRLFAWPALESSPAAVDPPRERALQARPEDTTRAVDPTPAPVGPRHVADTPVPAAGAASPADVPLVAPVVPVEAAPPDPPEERADRPRRRDREPPSGVVEPQRPQRPAAGTAASPAGSPSTPARTPTPPRRPAYIEEFPL